MTKFGLTLLSVALVLGLAVGVNAQGAMPAGERPSGAVHTGTSKDSAMDITISGWLEYSSVYRNRDINRVLENTHQDGLASSVAGGDAAGWSNSSDVDSTWFNRVLYNVRFDANLAEKVHAVIEFENQALDTDPNSGIGGANGGVASQGGILGGTLGSGDQFTDAFTVSLGQAYISVDHFLIEGLMLKLGIQNYDTHLRAGHGAFFIDLRGSELAFASGVVDGFGGSYYTSYVSEGGSGVAAGGAFGGGAPGPTGAQGTADEAFRDLNNHAGGFLATWTSGSFSIDAFWFTVLDSSTVQTFDLGDPGLTANVGDGHNDEELFGAVAHIGIETAGKQGTIMVSATGIANNSRSNVVWTLGAGADLYLTPEWELFGELLWQGGQAGFVGAIGDGAGTANVINDNMDQDSWAGYIGTMYTFDSVACKPWIELSGTWVDGDDGNFNDDNEDFISYENNDDTMILEDNVLGLDIDQNYWKVQLSGGLHFSVARENDLHVGLLLAWANVVDDPDRLWLRDADATAGADTSLDINDDLGTEIDLTARWDYSENLSFGVGAAWLLGADFFEGDSDTGGRTSGAGGGDGSMDGYALAGDATDMFLFTFDARVKF